MPNGWVHAANTLIAFGDPYFDVHRQKDAPSRILGSSHRRVNHDWYWRFGSSWSLENPFPGPMNNEIEEIGRIDGPKAAELRQVSVSHDYLDRVWDTLDPFTRKYYEGCMLWLLLNSSFLMAWAGIDIVSGGIQRTVDGREIWEPHPELRVQYKRLRTYAEAVWRKDRLLRDFLARYG